MLCDHKNQIKQNLFHQCKDRIPLVRNITNMHKPLPTCPLQIKIKLNNQHEKHTNRIHHGVNNVTLTRDFYLPQSLQ